MNLNGRSILLSGGGTGIGRELALLFAAKGGRLVLTGRRAAPLEDCAAMVRAAGGKAQVVPGDIADAAHRKAALDAAADAYGGLDVLINNAGNTAAGRLESIREADIRAMVEVNLVAPILLTRAALPLLRQSGDAMIVGIASGIALIGMPFYAVYAAAKAGLDRFDEAMRRELSGEGVHVMTAYPAATDTPMMATSAQQIVAGMEADALTVICGGEARQEAVRLNQTDPEQIDRNFAERKPTMEAAVRDHRAM
jgi:short-subunit dehydrogenase